MGINWGREGGELLFFKRVNRKYLHAEHRTLISIIHKEFLQMYDKIIQEKNMQRLKLGKYKKIK